MPLIDVSLSAGNLGIDDKGRLIAEITEAVVKVLGESARKSSIVTIHEIAPGNRGIGGAPYTGRYGVAAGNRGRHESRADGTAPPGDWSG
jgi:4-oxalocrotonate tautomerase